MSKQQLGKFTDFLSDDEVSFSKNAGKALQKSKWSKKLLADNKISGALSIEKNRNRTYEEFSSIKSALFEVRFAHALQQMKLDVEYEAKTGVGQSTVDFKFNYNNSIWLIELTSIRESDAVKKATSTNKDGHYDYLSITNNTTNSPEILELIKLQNVIFNKAQQNGKSHKFPQILDNTYHVIIVDVRSNDAGISDHFDYHIVTYGSRSLENVNDGVYCRSFIDKGTGIIQHIKGVYEPNNPDSNSKIIRERIHFICFIKEEEYKENEIINKMDVFPNPNFFKDSENFSRLWPFYRI
ncbi:hypothetical protein [Legionella pneumophila]|uniref:hypothetical protein n=1 Tax=Legionella pneumophila TaxID=446 RepID=UPI001A21B52C|nr:hypothetical protein [Legionella pneumophila]HDP0033869.1 hypothetical protein [Legionella pneumophila]HEN4769133.1 hypothetical protein [Legionella pneumophila]